MSTQVLSNLMSRPVVALALAALSIGVLPVGAQPRGGLSPEEREKVHAAQAATVAASLKLDAEKSAKLSETYTAAKKAAVEARPEGGGGRGDFEAMRKYNEAQKAKMLESFKGFLDEAQATEAANLLGGFNRMWDRHVAVLLSFGLDEAKQKEALDHTLVYARTANETLAKQNVNPNVIRDDMEAAKSALDAAIAPLLTDAQKTEWAERTARGPRGGGDRGPGPGPGRGDDGGRGGDQRPGGAPEPAAPAQN